MPVSEKHDFCQYLCRLSDRSSFDLIDYSRIDECGGVAQIGYVTFCYFAQNAAHDLTATCAGQTANDLYFVRAGECPNYLGHMVAYVFVHRLFVLDMAIAYDVGIYALAFDIMRISYDCTFYDLTVYVDGVFELACADPVP